MYKLPFRRAAGETRAAGRGDDAIVPVPSAATLLQAIALPPTAPLARFARRWHSLGPVLWLWRAAPGRAADLGTIAGWNCLHRIEPDGICEALRFYRDDGRELARLHLLPDSDYLAWEQLLQCVPCGTAEPPRGLHQRLCDAARVRAGHPWQGAVVRFCHGLDAGRPWLLAEAIDEVSATGRRRAVEICSGLDAVLLR